jgi:hypothetical protein
MPEHIQQQRNGSQKNVSSEIACRVFARLSFGSVCTKEIAVSRKKMEQDPKDPFQKPGKNKTVFKKLKLFLKRLQVALRYRKVQFTCMRVCRIYVHVCKMVRCNSTI